MPTVTPILDKRRLSKDGYPIKIRLRDKEKQRHVFIGYRVQENQWNGSEVVKHKDKDIINAVLSEKLNEAKKYIADCQIKNQPVKLDLIGTGSTSYSFCDYLCHRAKQYEMNGQIIMKRKLNRFAKELVMCFGQDILFDDVTADLLREFDGWLKSTRENVNNTRAKKFKFLSEYYDHAIREGRAHLPNPFKSHKIKSEPVRKDKLTVKEINAIEQLPLAEGPVNDARNLFLFSYYCKGMRFAKCLTLQRSQFRGGRIFFQTDKGKKYISVKIHDRLKRVLDTYKKREIVFPFLTEIPESPAAYLRAVDSQNVIVNRHLKTIAGLCGIKTNLTFHLARHSFAYHLKSVTNNVNVIQDALGHSDQRITEIYLKALDDKIIDREVGKLYG